MWIAYMFKKTLNFIKKYKKHCAVRKKEATEAINFGFAKPEQFVSSKKTFIGFKDTVDKKDNII